MKVVFVDYSELYYQEIAKTAMPEKRTGKFIQIRNNDTEYLVFSPTEYTPYHADLAERFCREKGLKGSFDRKNKCYVISDPAWGIAGGGKFEIDNTEKQIRLYDNSMAYGRFDRRGLKEKILAIVSMSDYKALIE